MLRTVLDARAYVLAPSKDRELRPNGKGRASCLAAGRYVGAAGRGGFETRRNEPISEKLIAVIFLQSPCHN